MKTIVHKKDVHVLNIIKPDMNNGPWIAGGAVMRWVNGEAVGRSDIDVFCRDEQQLNDVCLRITEANYTSICITDNAVSYNPVVDTGTMHGRHTVQEHQIQVIKMRYFKTAKDVIDSFDLTCCQFVTDGYTVLTGERSVEDLKNKILNTNNNSPDIIKRMIKYAAYGYTPSEEMLEFIEQNKDRLKTNFKGSTEYDNAF